MCKDQSASGAKKPVSDGQVAAFARMLTHYPGGGEMFQLAMSDSKIRAKLWNLIDCSADEQALRLPLMQRPPSMTIQLGAGPISGQDFAKAIRDVGGGISPIAENILNAGVFTVAHQLIELDLVIVSMGELGFLHRDRPKFREICAKMETLSLELCPLDVAPQICLRYMEQLKARWIEDLWLFIGMEPITASDDGPRVLAVSYSGGDCFLGSERADAYDGWDVESTYWMLVRPRRQ